MIGILDYGMGNIGSIENMLRFLNHKSVIVNNSKELRKIDKLILPGVGRFDKAMEKISKTPEMIDTLNYLALEKRIPILGVCLGMQLLTNYSEEGAAKGLGWINGRTEKFLNSEDLKIPHMGWNTSLPRIKNTLTKNIDSDSRYYFVHSYCVKVESESSRMMTTNYGVEFDSGIVNDEGNIYGVQFHPEKSHKFGMKIYQNFIEI
jgi:glutamine amidotransferase